VTESPATVPPRRATRLTRRAGTAIRSTTSLLGSDLRSYGAATVADQAARVAVNVVAAAVLGPVGFGTWVLVSSLIQYSTFTSLGIVHGAAREIPRLHGAEEAASADGVEDVATAAALSTGLLAGIGSAALTPVLFGPDVNPVLVGLAVFLQQAFFLQQILFRANLRFGAAAGQLASGAVGLPAAGLPLLRFGPDGLVLARILVNGGVVLLALRRLPRVPRPRWRRAIAADLLRVGAPVMMAGLVFALLITIDRWLIDALLGRTAVGQYGLVTLAIGGLLVVPTFLSQQLYPRLSHERGAGATGRLILQAARQFGLTAALLTGAAGLLASLVAIVAIPRLLPDYAPAIPAVIVSSTAVAVYAATSGLGYVLNLTGRQRTLVVCQVAALAADVSLSVTFARLGLGLVSFSLALLLTFIGYGIALTVLAGRAAIHDIADRPAA
jgi:O-antigen/teichoic acid export membrane protein